jgi:ParB/RepB/Spo0J family partition protein
MTSTKVIPSKSRLGESIQQRDLGRLKPHPEADLIPQMRPDEYNDLVEDIEQRGIVDPLVVTGESIVIDGRHRLMAAKALGLESVPVREFEGDASEQRDFMLRAALLRRHLTTAQRKALAAQLIITEPGRSGRSVAKAAGISRPTVTMIRHDLEAHEQVAESATSTGTDGKTYPRPVTVIEGFDTPETETPTEYDDLFAHAEDPKTRYRLGEKLNGERVDGDYPKGRLRAIAKQHGTTIGKLKEHVAYWGQANLGQYVMERQISPIAECWPDLDDSVAMYDISYTDVISTIPAQERKQLRASLRKGIKRIEKMIEALT